MLENYPIAVNALKELSKAGVLDEVILIGSWCNFFIDKCRKSTNSS